MRCHRSAFLLTVVALSAAYAVAIEPGSLLFFNPALGAYTDVEPISTTTGAAPQGLTAAWLSGSEALGLVFAAVAFLLAARRTAPVNLRTVHSRLRAKPGRVPTR
jgi:hypothetical protein